MSECCATDYIAHPGKDGSKHQTVKTHLIEVSELAAFFAEKIGQHQAGELIGLLHDFGKYSQKFQDYIKSAAEIISPDEDDYIDAKAHKGKIDHSTAGTQWIFENLSSHIKELYKNQKSGEFNQAISAMQILALCVASHHSGLIDNISPDPKKGFMARIRKDYSKTHYDECVKYADPEILEKGIHLAAPPLLTSMMHCISGLSNKEQNGFKISEISQAFYIGMYTKFIFSCLIDADRINSADFETPENKHLRHLKKPNWNIACQRVEDFVSGLDIQHQIDTIRRRISDTCKERAIDGQGIYSLTVPTGGGKTYSSLRYAVHHAKQHDLDRIIYIIPYTSIIDQNAEAIRGVLEHEDDERPWVLEHHSNLDPEMQTWRSKLVSENWDAPVVLTTMVQFLETLFSGGTRGARRLHQLANSVIIFDEIQTLPINCTHLFCNAINYLSAHCYTTAVLCTATQPLLNELKNPDKGQLHLLTDNELMPNIENLFDDLSRVEIIDKTRIAGWSLDELTELIVHEMSVKQSCLVIVNTKDWALKLYQTSIESANFNKSEIFHLSTSQCPAHRKQILETIRKRLDNNLPVLCFSTALIEAGVDVDFSLVIRFLAGMDSIAQAAGRCNRNGRLAQAQVYIVNPNQENIDLLKDIKDGIEASKTILNEFKGQDLLAPNVMSEYFKYYFYDRSDEMSYSLKNQDGSVLDLLSNNSLSTVKTFPLPLKQSFMTAGKVFKAIDAPTQALIVPFGEGKRLLADLCAVSKHFDAGCYFSILKKLQQYSVNLFPNIWRKLQEQDAIQEIGLENGGEGDEIYYLDKRFYSSEFGVSIFPSEEQRGFII